MSTPVCHRTPSLRLASRPLLPGRHTVWFVVNRWWYVFTKHSDSEGKYIQFKRSQHQPFRQNLEWEWWDIGWRFYIYHAALGPKVTPWSLVHCFLCQIDDNVSSKRSKEMHWEARNAFKVKLNLHIFVSPWVTVKVRLFISSWWPPLMIIFSVIMTNKVSFWQNIYQIVVNVQGKWKSASMRKVTLSLCQHGFHIHILY